MIHGLGTDIVEITRIREMIERHGEFFLERCFTPKEIAWAQKYKDNASRFAGRWAAKEAVVKALGTGFVRGVTFHDIEILPLHTGQPTVQLTGGAQKMATQLGISEIKISISHSEDYAVATAIGVGSPT
jgi:holo-[acyl-carrier protein] synthase